MSTRDPYSITSYRTKKECIIEFPFSYPSRNKTEGLDKFVRAKYKDKFLQDCYAVIKSKPREKFTGPVKILIDLSFKTRRKMRRDIDNYSPKWLLDALVMACIIVDDNSDIVPEPADILFIDKQPENVMAVKIVEL